ncbi:hypothetical protein [Rubrobacter aplysinae]|uniref:hypothetical protein n=1 Tax=Rubrobacter aplysinae TaxID=909625 RepID=UPI00128B63CE|nr:hypothetical protein [Rubrobacter aplysinae]
MMRKLLKGAALLGAAVGTAYAVKAYLDRSAGAGGDEVQISFEDGTTEMLSADEAKEFTDIASGVLRSSGR